MARPRKHPKKPPPRIHDRQATELPINAMVFPVTVDDPYEAGATIIAIRSLRDDPLGRLHARDQLRSPEEKTKDSQKAGRNTGEARYSAGRIYQRLLERAEIGCVKAMDFTKEPVDGGGFAEVLTEGQQVARRKLVMLDRALGLDGAAIMRDMLGHRMFFDQIAQKRGMSGPMELRYLARRARECLECLAQKLGLAGC